jgi:hypothetical protein
MGVRGQSNEAWLKRWREGLCPVHGIGFVPDAAAEADATPRADNMPWPERCPDSECVVQVSRWPDDSDKHHGRYGWRGGPAPICALLIKSSNIAADGDAPGRYAKRVRVSYPIDDDGA